MQTWRRRECIACKAVFTTNELIELSTSLVVRHENYIQPFSRDKLFVSILRAVGHRQQPIADASSLTATIISDLIRIANKAAFSPQTIAQITHRTLGRFDSSAAVQYQAYHQRTINKT